MREVQNKDELACLLQTSFPRGLSGVIGIDGKDGVGKTCLANSIQKQIGGTVISLDPFVAKNYSTFIPHLNKADLKTALDVKGRPLIVEGICLLAALAAVSTKPDLLIYVKLVLKWYWLDEDVCDSEEEVNALIQRLSPVTPLTPRKQEIIRYHCEYRPSSRADITYLQPISQ